MQIQYVAETEFPNVDRGPVDRIAGLGAGCRGDRARPVERDEAQFP